jgi:hypothetical protein
MSPAGFRKQYPLNDARMGEKRNAYRIQMGKPEGKEITRKI